MPEEQVPHLAAAESSGNDRRERSVSAETDMIGFLAKDNKALKEAGCKMAQAALRVVHEYDGVHRLQLTVSAWSKALADEGGRAERYSPQDSTLPGDSDA